MPSTGRFVTHHERGQAHEVEKRIALAGALTALFATALAGQASAAPPSGPPAATAPGRGRPRRRGPGIAPGPNQVASPDRDLAKGWKTSQDRAVTWHRTPTACTS